MFRGVAPLLGWSEDVVQLMRPESQWMASADQLVSRPKLGAKKGRVELNRPKPINTPKRNNAQALLKIMLYTLLVFMYLQG